ncbi:MAG TPA: PAS domain S-box protein [Rhodocyclaceae bacterium]
MAEQGLAAAVFEGSPAAMGMARLSDGCMAELNPAFETLSGYSRREILGRSLVQLGLWVDAAGYRRLVDAASSGKRVVALPTSLRTKDGRLFEARISAHVVEAGGERYLAAIFSDSGTIADLENAIREREASRSAAVYRAVVETCSDGFWMLDDDARLVAVNQAYIRLSGYTREELLGMSVADLDATESRDEILRRMARLKTSGNDLFTTWHRTKDGRQWLVEVVASYWVSAEGLYFVFLRDISERQRVSDALWASEARFRSIFEQAAVGMALVRPDGQWLRVNDKFCSIVGYSEAELTERGFQDITHPDDLPTDEHRIAEMLAGRMSMTCFEKRYVHKGGRIVWVSLTSSLVRDEAGLPAYFISVIEDISERKLMEAELESLRRRVDNMTRFEVAGQTVAALAHELNQPLNAVSSYAEAALRLLNAPNPRPEKLRHALEMSAQQAQRAGQVVHDLVAFLRHNEVQKEAVDINDLARKTVKHIKANAHDGIRFSLDLAPGLPVVRANRLQIQKVLTNLVENGIEAMHFAGSPHTAIAVSIRTAADGDAAQVTVADTGPGIDADIMHRVFDTFFTTKPNGLGVGLSISRTIVESHGGRLWVESTPGAGASFHFTLPFAT